LSSSSLCRRRRRRRRCCCCCCCWSSRPPSPSSSNESHLFFKLGKSRDEILARRQVILDQLSSGFPVSFYSHADTLPQIMSWILHSIFFTIRYSLAVLKIDTTRIELNLNK
jgi:hypothetical protein